MADPGFSMADPGFSSVADPGFSVADCAPAGSATSRLAIPRPVTIPFPIFM